MRIMLHNHQGKADALYQSLEARGHVFSQTNPDLLLMDHDGPDYYRSVIEQAVGYSIPVVLYSHGATSYCAWDGLWPSHPATQVYLAISQAERDVMQAYGYPHPVEVIGWYWSELSTARKVTGRRVLYAPIHLLTNGFIPAPARAANAETFALLLAAGVELTVRHIGDLEAQGLWIAENVAYQRGDDRMDPAVVEGYDLVVSYGTFAYLAIARGVATRMYAQEIAPWDGYTDETLRHAVHFDEYRRLMEYPYSVVAGEDPFCFERPERLAEWKAEHIGNRMDPVNLERILERIVSDAS
jgi:hypothetical protein